MNSESARADVWACYGVDIAVLGETAGPTHPGYYGSGYVSHPTYVNL